MEPPIDAIFRPRVFRPSTARTGVVVLNSESQHCPLCSTCQSLFHQISVSVTHDGSYQSFESDHKSVQEILNMAQEGCYLCRVLNHGFPTHFPAVRGGAGGDEDQIRLEVYLAGQKSWILSPHCSAIVKPAPQWVTMLECPSKYHTLFPSCRSKRKQIVSAS
jgi:hypothetical protein